MHVRAGHKNEKNKSRDGTCLRLSVAPSSLASALDQTRWQLHPQILNSHQSHHPHHYQLQHGDHPNIRKGLVVLGDKRDVIRSMLPFRLKGAAV